jgi:hypothetical protein
MTINDIVKHPLGDTVDKANATIGEDINPPLPYHLCNEQQKALYYPKKYQAKIEASKQLWE